MAWISVWISVIQRYLDFVRRVCYDEGALTMAQHKILRILTRLNIGGPAIHAALLTTRLDPRRFPTCLVVGEPDPTEGDLSGLIDADSARLVRVNSLRRPIRPLAD